MLLQRLNLLGHFLTGTLQALSLSSQFLLQAGIQGFLLLQGLMQAMDLGLQRLILLIMGQLQLGQFFFMLASQAADAQALLLDQLRSFEAMLLVEFFPAALRFGLFLGLFLGIPAVFRGHL